MREARGERREDRGREQRARDITKERQPRQDLCGEMPTDKIVNIS
jgi:hypothetical protein